MDVYECYVCLTQPWNCAHFLYHFPLFYSHFPFLWLSLPSFFLLHFIKCYCTDDDNRIVLQSLSGCSDCQKDYINASYVDVCIYTFKILLTKLNGCICDGCVCCTQLNKHVYCYHFQFLFAHRVMKNNANLLLAKVNS